MTRFIVIVIGIIVPFSVHAQSIDEFSFDPLNIDYIEIDFPRYIDGHDLSRKVKWDGFNSEEVETDLVVTSPLKVGSIDFYESDCAPKSGSMDMAIKYIMHIRTRHIYVSSLFKRLTSTIGDVSSDGDWEQTNGSKYKFRGKSIYDSKHQKVAWCLTKHFAKNLD